MIINHQIHFRTRNLFFWREKDDSYIPFSFTLGKQNLSGSNKPLEKAFKEKMSKLDQEKKKVAEEQVGKEKQPVVQEPAAQEPDVYIRGRVTKVQFPDVKGLVNPIYKNSIFLDNIKRISKGFIIKREQAHTICNTNNGL